MQFFSHAKWQIICVYQWVKNSSFNIFTSCGKSHLHNMENMENMLPHIFIKYTLLLGWIPFWIWIDIWWVCKYKRWYKLCDIAWRLASVLLEIAIRRWVQCGHKEMDMIRNDTQVGCDIKQCSFGTKGHCVPKWISPSPLHHHRQAWTIVTWQDKSMLFFFFFIHQILTQSSKCCNRNGDSSYQATLPNLVLFTRYSPLVLWSVYQTVQQTMLKMIYTDE